MKDLKIKLKNDAGESKEESESLEKAQIKYHLAISGEKYIEESIAKEKEAYKDQDPVNVKAAELISTLYHSLKDNGFRFPENLIDYSYSIRNIKRRISINYTQEMFSSHQSLN